MRVLNGHSFSVILACFTFLPVLSAGAQPSPGQLADMIIERNTERLRSIDVLEITVVTEDGVIPETTTRYVKRSEEGRVWLEPDESEPEVDSGLLSGVFDDQLPIIISGASSVENDRVGDFNVYRVFIDDADLLNSLISDQMEFDDVSDEMEVKTATVWLDRDELIARKLKFDQTDGENRDLTIDILLDDYRNHSGLPVSHKVTFQISGLESQFSDQEIEEARRGMEEFRKQLEQMPEAQRRMIEQQMRPQIERMEMMLESGEIGDMVFLVKEVKVNP